MLLFLVAGKSGCLRKGQGAQRLRQEAEQGGGAGGKADLTGGICRQLGPCFPFRVSQLSTLPPQYPGKQTSMMAKPHRSPSRGFIFP